MSDTQFTVTKTVVESYKIRSTRDERADIVIDANGNSGRIQIASDYGDWQCYWDSCGVPFKEFLAGLDMHYMAKNMGASRFFDIDATLDNFRKLIRASKELNPKEAAALLEDCNSLSSVNVAEAFQQAMWYKPELMAFLDNAPEMIFDTEPGFRNFFERIWPVLMDQFRKEQQQVEEVS